MNTHDIIEFIIILILSMSAVYIPVFLACKIEEIQFDKKRKLLQNKKEDNLINYGETVGHAIQYGKIINSGSIMTKVDNSSGWYDNAILAAGCYRFDKNLNRIKVGDGKTRYKDLPYLLTSDDIDKKNKKKKEEK